MADPADTAPAASGPPAIELSLGYYGALRIHLEPRVELTPEPKDYSVNKVVNKSVPVVGKHKNVAKKMPCQLTWIIETDRVSKRWTHTRPTFVEPSGADFKVREHDKDLTLDAFEAGLIGVGKIGYSIKLSDLLGAAEVEKLPGTTGIHVELPADVWFDEMPPPASAAAPAPRTKTPPNLQVGKGFKVIPDVCPAFNDHHAKLVLALFHGDVKRKDTDHSEEWKVGEAVDLTWRAGMHPVSDGLGLCYHRGVPDGGSHRCGWLLTLSRPDPADSKATQSIEVPFQHIGDFPHPSLGSFSLSTAPRATPPDDTSKPMDFVVEARLSGFDPSFDLSMAIDVYAKLGGDGLQLMLPISLFPPPAWASSMGLVPPIKPRHEVAAVKNGVLREVILSDTDVAQTMLFGRKDLLLFATLRFPASLKGTQNNTVFQRLASYTPNLANDGDHVHAGFAPMRDGKLVVPDVAWSVCSNLVTMDGVMSRLEGPGYSKIELLALATCIWTEARNNDNAPERENEMLHVGGVIMNRLRTSFHGKTTLLGVVLDPMQFSFFNNDSPLKQALAASDPDQVEAWREGIKALSDAERFDECLVVAGTLINHPDANPFADDEDVRHYYSPVSMRPKGSVPDWVTKMKPGVTCAPDGGEVSVPGIVTNRFHWYRGIY